jgi:hypothetical protein
MRPGSWLGLALMISVLLAGCAPKPSQPSKVSKSSQDDIAVLFDGIANLCDQGVYLNGVRIGQIQSSQLGAGNVTKTSIQLSPEAVQMLGNMVFYIDMCQLKAVELQGVGAPFQKGAPLCGFTSKAELNWFKFKTLLSDRIAAAKRRAAALQARFG